MFEMDMKTTRANVEEYAKMRGYEPVQIDGIPEGFSFQKPSVTINGFLHPGKYVAFVPLSDWENSSVLETDSIVDLMDKYKRRNGK